MTNKLVPEVRLDGFREEWVNYKWRETVNMSTNMVDPKSGQYDSIMHVGPGNIESYSGRLYSNVKTVKEDNLISGKFHFSAGDILYGKINPQLAKFNLAVFEGLASADTYVLNAKNGISQLYLYTIIQTSDFYKYSVSVSRRTGMPKINRDELNQYTYNGPKDFKEQQKIGEFFKQLDDRIALQQRHVEQLKQSKQGFLQKMFPKDGESVPEVRFDGFSGEWNLYKLGDLGSVAMNKRIFKHETLPDGEIPFYKIGTFGDKANSFISRELYEKYKSKYPYPKKGDILISASGSIGRTKEYNGEEAYYQDSNIVWLEHGDNLCNSFLKQFYEIVKWNGVEGTTIKRLYNKNILNTEIKVPIIKEQQKIGEFFKQLDDLIAKNERELELLQETKKGFLQKMFV